MGDASARELIRLGLLPDIYSNSVPRNASVSVARKGLLVVCHGLPIVFHSSNIFWGLNDTEIVKNTETRFCPTKFGKFTFIPKCVTAVEMMSHLKFVIQLNTIF